MTLKQFVIAGLTAATVIFAVVGFGYVGRTIVQGATTEQVVEQVSEIPDCEEDEAGLLRGVGDYSNGRFESYECLHVDELGAMAYEDLGMARAFAAAICEHPDYFERNLGVWLIDNLPDSNIPPVCVR